MYVNLATMLRRIDRPPRIKARSLQSPKLDDELRQIVRVGFLAHAESDFATAEQRCLETLDQPPQFLPALMVEDDGYHRFTQGYRFETPSGASAVVLGCKSNGWTDWKNADGATLHEVQLADALDE